MGEEQKQFIGVLLYHSCSGTEVADALPEVMRALERMDGGVRLSWFRGRFAGSRGETRLQRLTPPRLRTLAVDIRAGVLDRVYLNEVRGRLLEDSAGIEADIVWAGDPESRTPGEGALGEIQLVSPCNSQISTERLIDGMTIAARALSPEYGFVHVASTRREINMEVTAIPGRPWGQQLSNDEKLHLQHLGLWQMKRRLMGKFIRTAYYGNLLGPGIVMRLGGIRRVLEDSPVKTAIELPGGGAYLQVESSICERRIDVRSQLSALAEFLSPVAMVTHFPADLPRID